MVSGSFNGRFFAGAALLGFMLAAAGCQSSDKGILGVGGNPDPTPTQSATKVTASSLQAYCPKVTLRSGTAYFSTYAKGGKSAKPAQDADSDGSGDRQNDSSKIIYQASISDVTRDCSRANGTLTLNVAVAGKVVPGPMGSAGTITMPIRIVVVHGADILYSQLHQYKVQIADTSAATQFVFNDANVNVPEPTARDYQVFAGYDEVKQAKPDDAKPHRKKIRSPKKKPEVAAAPPKSAPASTSISDIPR